MEPSSPGKLLPQVLLPYAQQWAERSGLDLLSKLLADAQLRELLGRYGDELYTSLSTQPNRVVSANGSAKRNGSTNGRRPSSREHAAQRNGAANETLDDLTARVAAVEAQHEALQNTLDALRSKLSPLALALGCCPECLFGLAGCPNCAGEGNVGRYSPDLTLLKTEILEPLSAQGVRLHLRGSSPASRANSTAKSPKTRRRT